MGQEISIFDFASGSVDEELDSKMTLLKFIQQRMVSLGNEEQLMHGTYIDADVNLERFKSVLLTEYKSKDSLNQIEHS